MSQQKIPRRERYRSGHNSSNEVGGERQLGGQVEEEGASCAPWKVIRDGLSLSWRRLTDRIPGAAWLVCSENAVSSSFLWYFHDIGIDFVMAAGLELVRSLGLLLYFYSLSQLARLPRITYSGALVASVARLGGCEAFAIVGTRRIHCHISSSSGSALHPFGIKPSFRTYSRTSAFNMSDEVEAAKKAAAEYEASDKDGAGPPTVFDKILSGEWDSKKVYDDDKCYAFRDVNPQAPVHVLVIPKRRDGMIKLSTAREDQSDLLGHMLYVAGQIGKKECPKGFRIVINDGEQGSQAVYHLHIHVFGGRQMQWPPG